MARYIFIDNHSGYIFGDTGDLQGPARDETPIEAARRLDRAIDPSAAAGREYEETSRCALASNETGYHVYRADVRRSEAVPLVSDGRDQETIEAVERSCDYVTTIRVIDAADKD